MRQSLRVILLFALACIAGCAADRKAKPAATAPADADMAPAVRAEPPAPKGDAYLQLDEIPGRPELVELLPASRPAARPPLDAVNLYAQATNALHAGRRTAAIDLLERALALDPDSFELNYALGRAHEAGRTHHEQSIRAFERAAAINPDHLELQTGLGRQYLARGEDDKALEHLRLAVQTSGYKADQPAAAATDLFLGRALQEGGYDRAALEQYASLLRRVQGPAARRDPHLGFLVTNQLYLDIGDLYARNGMYADALAAYEPVARREPADFDVQARIVRALVGERRFNDAAGRARELVVRFRAGKPSLDLLREVHRAGGGERGAADELAAAHAERPGDTAVLFALVELLKEDGRWADAERYLVARAAGAPGEFDAIRRLVHLRLERADAAAAARLLVETLAAQPDHATEIDSLWADVITPARADRFRLAQLRSLDVPRTQAAAKEMSIAFVAGHLRREALVDQSLARATALRPPLAPAFRERLSRLWQREGLDDAERTRVTDELVAAARQADPVLAQELTGLSLLHRKQDEAAATALAKAREAAGSSPAPALLHEHALALRAAGDAAKFEQTMWKLISDRPSYENAYSTLYSYYSDAGSEAQSARVLNTWLVAVPHSTSARLLQAAGHFRAGRTDAAEELLSRLIDERGHDRMVLSTAYAFYTRAGHAEVLTQRLESLVREQPGNLAAVGVLVELYNENQRAADAVRAIDAARAALADDPDHLYQVAHLYTTVDQRLAMEETLRQVLAVDPAHPPASNDLGYGWAERGDNLRQAEALIRQAVAAEPDNGAFLDSLGWVLYKRGKFAEARAHLEKAAADVTSADPVVLDHLGDLLYRLGDRAAAARNWDQAATKLIETPAEREDLTRLKLELNRKSAQLKAGQPVTVSPVVEEAAHQATSR